MRKFFKSSAPMIATSLAAGAILSILAPYGTQSMTLVWRLTFWIGLCLVGGLAVTAASVLLERRQIILRSYALAFVYSIASALAVFLMLLAMTYYQGGRLGAAAALQLFFYVWVIAFTISIVGVLADSRRSAETASTRPDLYQRLKPALRRATIYALSAEDHYVRVITDAGEDLILMRLSDAIKESAPLSGLSPHRSWWVAEQGVADAKSKTISLHSGHTVPVSRNGLKAVKEAGWV